MNPYANCVVYGPYSRKDGRQHVICIFPNKSRKTVSYPKYIVETTIGRLLTIEEEIHHIDKDFSNNEISNLQIINTFTHSILHTTLYVSQDFICPVCAKEFTLHHKQIKEILRNRSIGRSKTGPFCSRNCAGVGSDIRYEIRKDLVYSLSLESENSQVDPANSVEPIINGNAEQS